MINQLEKLFFGKDLVKLIKYAPVTPPRKIQRPVCDLTPVSKSIYDTLTPVSKKKILKDFSSNDAAVSVVEERQENTDPDYQEKFENRGLGFYAEDYISYHGFCPICGANTLRKYKHANIPVVDLVCINKDYHLEENQCFLFQIKISLNKNYFDLNRKKISVGSKKFGIIPHQQKGTSDTVMKHLVPGYICLYLEEHPSNIQTYIVNHRNSFVLIPDLNSKLDQPYYQYLPEKNIYGKDVITWNSSMVTTHELRSVLTTGRVIYETFEEYVMANPYANLIKN